MRIEVHSEDSLHSMRVAQAAIGDLIEARERNTPQPAAPEAPPSAAPVDPPAKRTRRTKAEIEAAKASTTEVVDAAPSTAPAPTPIPTEALKDVFAEPPKAPASSFLDDDPPAVPAKVYSKDDVRAALVALQLKRTGQFREKGQSEIDAAKSAEAATKKVLLDATGSERLGGVPETAYAAVVAAANAAAGQSI